MVRGTCHVHPRGARLSILDHRPRPQPVDPVRHVVERRQPASRRVRCAESRGLQLPTGPALGVFHTLGYFRPEIAEARPTARVRSEVVRWRVDARVHRDDRDAVPRVACKHLHRRRVVHQCGDVILPWLRPCRVEYRAHRREAHLGAAHADVCARFCAPLEPADSAHHELFARVEALCRQAQAVSRARMRGLRGARRGRCARAARVRRQRHLVRSTASGSTAASPARARAAQSTRPALPSRDRTLGSGRREPTVRSATWMNSSFKFSREF